MAFNASPLRLQTVVVGLVCLTVFQSTVWCVSLSIQNTPRSIRSVHSLRNDQAHKENPEFVHIDTASRQFKDSSGRSTLYHGVNVVYKVHPFVPPNGKWDPQFSLTEEDAAFLQDIGLNAVRLYVAWQGVMPSKGQVNSTYLDALESVVSMLGKHGIKTILDCHQDLLSPKFCGEGAPDFAAMYDNRKIKPMKFPLPIAKEMPVDPDTGYPTIKDCLNHHFFQYYFTDAVGKSFQSLYDNEEGVQDDFAAFWAAVATRFSSNSDVLGYELLNEPWSGDIYRHPNKLVSSIADRENLAPMYSKLNKAIRSADDRHIIFFEATTITSMVPFSKTTQTGLTEGPGGVAYNDRQAMSVHSYCILLTPDGQPKSKSLCHLLDDKYFHYKRDDLQRLGVAGFLTEWGALKDAAAGTPDYEEAETVTEQADESLLSWTYWQYKSFHDITTQAVDSKGNVEEGFFTEASEKYVCSLSR